LRNALFSGSNGIRENSSLLTHTSEKGVSSIVEDDRELVTGIHYINANHNGSFEEKKTIVFDPKKVFTEPVIDRFGAIKGAHYPSLSLDQDAAKAFVEADVFLPDFSYYRNAFAKDGTIRGGRIPAPWNRLDPQNKASGVDPTGTHFIDVHASPRGFQFQLVDDDGTIKFIGVDQPNFGKVLAANRYILEADNCGGGGVRKLVFAACGPAGGGFEQPLMMQKELTTKLGKGLDIFLSPHDVNIGTMDDDKTAFIEIDDSQSEAGNIQESWLHLPAETTENRQPKLID
jgi:hypothetical protein